jgi:hypothetical protein
MDKTNTDLILKFLDNKKIQYEIVSTKNDLDILSYQLLKSKKLRSELIKNCKKNNFTLITSITPDSSGRMILYFLNKTNFEEIVIDINHSSNKIIFNFLTTYIKAGNLFRNIYFVSESEYKKMEKTFQKTLMPIKFLNYKNFVSIIYYSLRGCLVFVSSPISTRTFLK